MPEPCRDEKDKIANSILNIQPFQVLESSQDLGTDNYRLTICSLFTRCLRPCCWDLESTISTILTEASLHTTSTDLLQELLELGPSIPPCPCLTLVSCKSGGICPLLLLPKEYLI